jgi:ABC-type nitrate/sulfonate/bicarbonate transport system substrate-binding protein
VIQVQGGPIVLAQLRKCATITVKVRSLMMVGAFLIFFLVLSVSARLAQAAEKIRISVSGSYNMIFLSAGVAQKKGFFQEEGLDADIVVMRAATSIAALASGDIDYTMLTGSVIRAAIRGLPGGWSRA